MTLLKKAPTQVPERLADPPILEAVFEVRFGQVGPDVGQLLPGILTGAFGTDYPRSEVLPVAALPADLRSKDPSLRFQPHFRLVGEKGSISIGDRLVAIAAHTPYEGWADFGPRISQLVAAITTSQVVEQIERFSLKFVNILESSGTPQLSLVDLQVLVGGFPLTDAGFQLRFELNELENLRIIEIKSNATVTLRNGVSRSGLLVSIDCIRQNPTGDMAKVNDVDIELIHDDLKKIFFGLLTEQTLQSLGPSGN